MKKVILLICALIPLAISTNAHGWPEVLWTHELDSHCYGSPAVADIDGDTKPEIIFGTYFGDEHAYALNAEDSTLLWKFYTGGGPLDAAPTVADVNQDGDLEVIMPSSWGVVFCLDSLGNVIWRYPASGYIECIDSPPAVADVDNDDRPEVIFGAWYGCIYVLNGEDGSLAWKRVYGVADSTFFQAGPNIVDLNDDSELDIVIATFSYASDNRVYALQGESGDTIWTFPTRDMMYHGGSFADIDHDSKPEIVIGDYSGYVYVINGEDGSLSWERHLGGYIFPPTSMADLNNDGELEIMVATGAPYRLWVLSSTNQMVWDYPVGGQIDRGAVVADIDGDDTLEVVFGAADCSLRVVNGEDGSLVWSYYAGDGYQIENGPVIEDFDGDGKLDIFFVGGYGVYPPEGNYGRAYALSAGDGTGRGWSMFRHDLRNSGCFEAPWPDIRIDPEEIFAFLPPDQQDEQILTIANDGELDLEFTVMIFTPSDSGWLGADPLDGVIASDSNMDLSVMLDATGLGPGLRSGELRILSNDPIDSLVSIPVALEIAPIFVRGDANADGNVTVADAVYIVGHVYRGGPSVCDDCCDANDDGRVTSADAIYMVSHIYRSGLLPPNPYPDCGLDPSGDELGCASHPCFEMR